MKLNRRIALAAATVLALPLGAGAALASTSVGPAPAAAAAPSSGGVKFAYFTQWGIYQNAFYPKNVHTSGMADKLDFINYAFANISPTDHKCFEATSAASQDENNPNAGDGAGDAEADFQKSYTADISVDGVADTWDQPLAGNFNQLKKLKAKHPSLKIVMSLGGWTYSKFFSDAAATDASRKALVSSCIDMFIKGNLPSVNGRGGAGSAAGIFDGIDIDWEYPGSPGGHLGNHVSPNDKANFTLLLKEFRTQLDAYGSANGGKKMWLTAALPAGQDKIAYIETDKLSQSLDYANLMTYDMHGGWEPQGPTNFQDPVYEAPGDPMTPVPPGNLKYSTDAAVTAWTTGLPAYGIPGGFPANKITIGYPFYYRGWTGVTAGANHGLYQAATGPAAGHVLSGNVPGVSFYKELTGFVDAPAKTFYDPVSQSAWFYDGTTLWAGDSKVSVKAKADYAHCKGLAGGMMYSLEGLDPAATLFNEAITDINGSTPGCVGPSPTPSSSPTGSPTASPSPSPTKSPTASPSPTRTVGPSPTSGGCTSPLWSAAAVYTGGNVVQYNGQKWTAQWWTQGETPGVAQVWSNSGPCGPSSPPPSGSCTASAWSTTMTYNGGAVVSYTGHKYRAKWWTQGETPGTAAVWEDQGVCTS